MKTSAYKIIFTLSVILMLAFFSCLHAVGQSEIVRETRDLPAFDKIDIGSAFEVKITFGEPQKVEIEAKEKVISNIITQVKDGKFTASAQGIKSQTPLLIFITVPSLEQINAHGASDLEGTNTLVADMLEITVSGASQAEFPVEVQTLRTKISGASTLKLSGTAYNHSTDVSGAATLNARNLMAQHTDASASGAATVKVNSEQLTGKTSGASEIYNVKESVKISETEVIIVKKDKYSDTTYVKFPGKSISVTESDDTVKIRVGNRTIVIDDDGNITTKRSGKPKFNGHWAGFDIGFNGYVNPDFNMSFPKEYEYMDLRMEKSVAINLNFFEQNIPFSNNQKWGMVTGLGFSFNNYRFMRPTRLSMDSSALMGYLDEGISIKKSKLTAMYLTLPVLFEFQTAPIYHKKGFHINTGIIVGARLTSHTKKYYDELNKEFNVTLYNPETGQYEFAYTAMSPDDPKAHRYGDWFLQPFKFDASVRIGWNFLNFWANYSLNTMFRKDKGPELYPWSAGITLVCF